MTDSRLSRREGGSGSVLVLAAILCIFALTWAVVVMASVAAAAHRARSAADLAAIAGATAGLTSPGTECAVAARTAAANGSRVVTCSGESVTSLDLTVLTPLPLRWPGLPTDATARARAGPGR